MGDGLHGVLDLVETAFGREDGCAGIVSAGHGGGCRGCSECGWVIWK